MTEGDYFDARALIPFETPTRITIVAATNGGKTYFVKRLLENAKGMFSKEFENIYYHYGSAYQPIFDEMARAIPNLIFRSGLPQEEELHEISLKNTDSQNCLVIDDLMVELNNNPKYEKLWTVLSHHYNLTIVYLTQNLFEKGKGARSISLNTSYFCLFRAFRDVLQIQHFAREAFPGKTKQFMQAYRMATSKEYGYLLVDLESRKDSRFRLRTNIFPGENTVVYDIESV